MQASLPTAAPLSGVRVLDLTRLLPGPLAAQHLADLGADVIKVEDLGAGDYANPAVRALVNHNKRAIRIDLKQAAGVDALLRLVRTADVLLEGFRPGVMARLGLGYELLCEANPRIVVCSLSGWGQTGPLRELPGHDLNYAALAGVTDQMAGLSNLPIADLLGGTMGAVMGTLAALFDAARTGRGRWVDIAMADSVLAHAVLPLAALHQHGRVPRPGEGTLTGALACYGLYTTADGRQIAVGALERKFWDAMCATLGRPELAPLHRSGNAATEARLRTELAALFATQPLAHWAELFADAPACVTPVLRLDETLAHPHFQARGMVVAGDPPQLGCAVKMSGFVPAAPRPAPQPGEHTDAVLAEAGLAAADIAALRASGAVG
ncbi:CaiB/BaiF CoA transferase family protein [Aquabacterium sp.]|uniref:CaiB/BaiF CoA transferase family protein n=1 Tax=Aquabacterium sp. TaxID=1872578 RepID=UPI002BB8675A|nr:CaiB/BaiF CoA-transferase family protein [Aquabacterium sp.]HSW09227.1 CaiB/BaiF CoA-transferase family protein [Aquabacterium sp.]